jgi:hypothetical protein
MSDTLVTCMRVPFRRTCVKAVTTHRRWALLDTAVDLREIETQNSASRGRSRAVNRSTISGSGMPCPARTGGFRPAPCVEMPASRASSGIGFSHQIDRAFADGASKNVVTACGGAASTPTARKRGATLQLLHHADRHAAFPAPAVVHEVAHEEDHR